MEREKGVRKGFQNLAQMKIEVEDKGDLPGNTVPANYE